MKAFLNRYGKTLVFFALAGLIGGFLVGSCMLDSYPAEIRQQVMDQGLDDRMIGVLMAVQYVCYGAVLGAAGIWLGRKVGLWKDERHIEKAPLRAAAAVSVIGGLALILPDLLIFGKYSQAIADSYAVKPTVAYMVGTVVLGGVIEEVMLRLFMMSLAAFMLHKIFGKGRQAVSPTVLAAANVIAALLFAAGHLPVNSMMFGLTPMIVLRCMLLNGAFGLAFGWIFRRYGLRYAMIAHGGCHVVSKVIWMLFV